MQILKDKRKRIDHDRDYLLNKENRMEIIDYRGWKIEIKRDEFSNDPRKEYDNLGTMVCFHRRYGLGDENHEIKNPAELENLINRADVIALPLYLYDHSGLTMAIQPFSCPWDSGQVGYIFVTYEKLREIYNVKRITKKTRALARSILLSEVELYDSYIRGDVFGYEITDSKGKFFDCCYGFYGHDNIVNELIYAKESIDNNIERERMKK